MQYKKSRQFNDKYRLFGVKKIRGEEAERNLPNVTTKKNSERILIYYNFYIFHPFRLLYSIFPPVLREFLLFIFIISQYCPTGLVCPTIWGEAAAPSANFTVSGNKE